MLTITDYYAPWCGPCKLMEPILHDLEKDFEGKIEIVKVNIDEEPEKGQSAGVMSIPTFILGDKRLVGFQAKEKFRQEIDSLLSKDD